MREEGRKREVWNDGMNFPIGRKEGRKSGVRKQEKE